MMCMQGVFVEDETGDESLRESPVVGFGLVCMYSMLEEEIK